MYLNLHVHHNFSHHYFYIAIITYILVQYCGHYFSESNCKPDQKETCCEGESVPIQTNKLRLFIWYNSCTRLDKWLICGYISGEIGTTFRSKTCTVPCNGQRICRTGCTFVDFCMWIFRGIQNILLHRGRGRPSRDYTHHHSPNLKYLPTPPQQVLVVTRTVPLAVAIAICQFLSTARQWIANYLCEAHLVLSLTWRRWCSPGLFLGPFIVPAFNSNLCRSN